MITDMTSIERGLAAMMKWKHILLALALITLAAGFSDARPDNIFYLGRPVGAILFGLFLIAQVLEQESAMYDEQSRAPEFARKPRELRQQSFSVQQEVAHYPAPTTANPR